MAKSSARKNQGKPRLGLALLMPEALEALSCVLLEGEMKYGPAEDKSWLTYEYHETMDSLMRHLTALKNGEVLDPESGLPHAYHIHFNSAVLVELSFYCSSEDSSERPPPGGSTDC